MSFAKNENAPPNFPDARPAIDSILLDHVTASVAMSQDQTPIWPASSATRTVAKSGKNACGASPGHFVRLPARPFRPACPYSYSSTSTLPRSRPYAWTVYERQDELRLRFRHGGEISASGWRRPSVKAPATSVEAESRRIAAPFDLLHRPDRNPCGHGAVVAFNRHVLRRHIVRRHDPFARRPFGR